MFKCRDFNKMKAIIIHLAGNKEFGHKFLVNEQFWESVAEIINVLQSAYKFTVEMQSIGYGLADFYIGWLRVQKNLRRHLNEHTQLDLAAKLMQHMENRSSSLFKTPLLLCSVYMDPRMMFTLTTEQKAEAAMSMVQIYQRSIDTNRTVQQHQVNDTLDEIREEYASQQIQNQGNTQHLFQALADYETEAAFDIHQPVMNFWIENSHKYPLLRPLADILHAVPSNQCCTERGFSGLSYIRSKFRMCMQPQNVSNVLMVRLNKDIFYTLRKERVQHILDKVI